MRANMICVECGEHLNPPVEIRQESNRGAHVPRWIAYGVDEVLAAHNQEHHQKPDMNTAPEFQRWRANLPTVVVDGERFYLPTGDVPMDESEVADYWIRLLLHRDQVERLQ